MLDGDSVLLLSSLTGLNDQEPNYDLRAHFGSTTPLFKHYEAITYESSVTNEKRMRAWIGAGQLADKVCIIGNRR